LLNLNHSDIGDYSLQPVNIIFVRALPDGCHTFLKDPNGRTLAELD
jgi:hypothetical protein